MKSRRTLKKLMILAISAVMVFAMTACGGKEGGQKEEKGKLYAGYYTAEIPDDFKVNKTEDEFSRPYNDSETSEEIIKCMLDTADSAESLRDYYIEIDTRGDKEKGEDIVIGDRTWKTLTFIWNGDVPSAMYFTEIDDEHVFQVDTFMMELKNEDVMNILKSIKFKKDPVGKARKFAKNLDK